MTTEELQGLRDVGVVAVIRAHDSDSALRAVEALFVGGVRGIEITFSTQDTASVIGTLAERHGSAIYLGAGTVVTPAQAHEAAEAGAAFLVSPGTDPIVAEAMRETGRTTLLGALTPSEVMSAVRLGAHAVKLFPASLGGPTYLKSLRGPFPEVPFIPTGGVTVDNIAAWRRAGVVAVGAGGDLCSTKDLAEGRWVELTERAQAFSNAWVESGR